jgi:alanine racemase
MAVDVIKKRFALDQRMFFMRELAPSGRPTVAEIDLRALEFNYRQIQKKVPRGTKILGVVKADAYGHGSLRVSLTLEALGIEYLGVAIPDEGIELRKGGVKTPILILGGVFSKEEGKRFLRYDLTPVVFEKESLRFLSRVAKKKRKRIKVHLKVDTGMGRLGVSTEDWPAFLQEVKRWREIEVEGILSHFSMADEDGGIYSREQWKKFEWAVAVAKTLGIRPRYLHMANSANLAAFAFCAGNLVRPGIMLYGSYPSPAFEKRMKLRPLMTLKTRIHFLKRVPRGRRISYGGTFVTKRESLIATLPIGYADGYNRLLSNRGEVLIRGRRAPVVGTVCMDYVMVDVSHIASVSTGDEVVLLGKQGKEWISAEEVAQKLGTISYEILCSVGKRVPRVYRS